MRRRNDERVRSSAGQVGSHGVRKSRLASRSAAHSAQSDICGARRTTPSPVIAGIRSEELTVRKNAMGDPPSDSSGRTMKNKSLSVHCVRLRRSDSRSPADETVGDSGGTFKPAAGAEGGNRRPSARNQGAAGGAGTLDRYSFDLTNELVERNRAAPKEH